ncbi:unnamed protein product [Somion occarium]|uniref:Uncharacterized protein n=1 Tax=Somion occarium TaxID=3059160 RepID=A0ABP1CMM7_9APHY
MKQSWMLVNLDMNETENISSLGRRMLNGLWDNLIGMLAHSTGIKFVPDILSKREQDTTADFESDKECERKSDPPPQRSTLGRLELFPDASLHIRSHSQTGRRRKPEPHKSICIQHWLRGFTASLHDGHSIVGWMSSYMYWISRRIQ